MDSTCKDCKTHFRVTTGQSEFCDVCYDARTTYSRVCSVCSIRLIKLEDDESVEACTECSIRKYQCSTPGCLFTTGEAWKKLCTMCFKEQALLARVKRAQGTTPTSPASPSQNTIHNTSLALTYAGRLDKAKYISWFTETIRELAPELTILFIRLAHESPDKVCPYDHSHVLFQLSAVLVTNNPMIFSYEGATVHWNYVLSKEHLARCKSYLSKEDRENFDLRDDSIPIFHSAQEDLGVCHFSSAKAIALASTPTKMVKCQWLTCKEMIPAGYKKYCTECYGTRVMSSPSPSTPSKFTPTKWSKPQADTEGAYPCKTAGCSGTTNESWKTTCLACYIASKRQASR